MMLQTLLYLSCISHLGTHKKMILRGRIQGIQQNILVISLSRGSFGPSYKLSLSHLQLCLSLDSVSEFYRHGNGLRILIMHLSPALMVHLNVTVIRLAMTIRSIRFLTISTAYNRYSLTRVPSGRLGNPIIALHP